MNLKSLILSCALVAGSATTGFAATYILGDVTGGASTTQTLRVRTIDFIEFTVGTPGGSPTTDLIISVTSTPGSNFREIIALYSGSTLVAQSDRGKGNGGGTATLSLVGPNALASGSYALGVGAWRSFFTASKADARSTAYFNNGSYTADFAPQVSPVPLPAGAVMLLTGIGAFAFARRKTHKARG